MSNEQVLPPLPEPKGQSYDYGSWCTPSCWVDNGCFTAEQMTDYARTALAAVPAIEAAGDAPSLTERILAIPCDTKSTEKPISRGHLENREFDYTGNLPDGTYPLIVAASVAAGPVAWADAVEERMHSWRQRLMNRSGDHLALDDFMDAKSLDDLIDFVCAPLYAAPAKPQAMSLADLDALWIAASIKHDTTRAIVSEFARAIERHHGIGITAATKLEPKA